VLVVAGREIRCIRAGRRRHRDDLEAARRSYAEPSFEVVVRRVLSGDDAAGCVL
jgi:hypothetical protein